MTLDPETEARIEAPVSADAVREARLTPAEAVEHMRIRLPDRGNRKLRRILERANGDKELKGWWHVANVNAVVRLEINDHSWVHVQIVANIALKLLRQLTKHRIEPSLVRDYGMHGRGRRGRRRARRADALRRHVGAPQAATRTGASSSPSRSSASFSTASTTSPTSPSSSPRCSRRSRATARTASRSRSRPGSSGSADALDMAKGRSRIPFERGHVSMHSLSAAAIDEVLIGDGEVKPVRIEILMNNSSGLFQVDGLLRAKLARLGPRALRRGRSRTSTPRARSGSSRSTGSTSEAARRSRVQSTAALRDRLMVGRRILAPEVGVRVPVPQLEAPREGRFVVVFVSKTLVTALVKVW